MFTTRRNSQDIWPLMFIFYMPVQTALVLNAREVLSLHFLF